MTDSLLIAVYAFVSHVSMSVSVDETLLPWYGADIIILHPLFPLENSISET